VEVVGFARYKSSLLTHSLLMQSTKNQPLAWYASTGKLKNPTFLRRMVQAFQSRGTTKRIGETRKH
jgi:hypothetical protein